MTRFVSMIVKQITSSNCILDIKATWNYLIWVYLVHFTVCFRYRTWNVKYATRKSANGICLRTSRLTANLKACLANFAARNFQLLGAFVGTKRFIWTWRRISVAFVVKLLSKRPTCKVTSGSILGNGLSSVSFATKALCN